MVIHDLQVGSVALDPARDALKELLRPAVVVADHHACDERSLVQVVEIHLRRRDVEFPVEPRQQRSDPAALLFEGGAARDIEFDGQRGDVHTVSVERMPL